MRYLDDRRALDRIIEEIMRRVEAKRRERERREREIERGREREKEIEN